jgi:hypothetical protein
LIITGFKNLESAIIDMFEDNFFFLRQECKEAISSTDNNLVQTALIIIEQLFIELL